MGLAWSWVNPELWRMASSTQLAGQTTTGLSADTTGQITEWTCPDGAEGATTHPKTESETGQQEGLPIYLHCRHL